MIRALAVLLLIAPTLDDNVPPSMLRIDEPATVYAPAVRVDPPAPAPTPVLTNEEIIRAVWPDQLEDHAVRIAYRESRFQARVRTWCCFGLMQIHREHLAWLCPQLGICTTEQLYDPWLNARAAYALYLRDGWDPWAT